MLEQIVHYLIENRITISTMESCTGGLLARSLKVGRILQTQLDNGLSEGIVEIPPMMKLGISSIRISTVQ